MEESLTTRAVQHRGRGQVFDSIVDAIGDTPIVRLQRRSHVLDEVQHGALIT